MFSPKLARAVLLASLLSLPALAKGRPDVQLSGSLNLNDASPAQLDLLPGVGEKAAHRIVDYRTRTPFKRVEELVRVKGFGRKKLLRLRPHLSVSGPTTLAIRKIPDASPTGKTGAP